MTTLSKTGRYRFLAEPFHCDFSGHLFMGHLGNRMLNAADFHSNDRGFGMNSLNPVRKTWVLSRLAIEMYEMPVAYTRFYVETWVESVMRYFTNRNFKVEDAETGQVYGYGRSVWAMIDMDTRQPSDIFAVHDGAIVDYVDAGKDCPIAGNSRVKRHDCAKPVRTVDTGYSDIDMNGHVNSVKYIEHILDLFGVEWYRENRLSRFEIAYVAESHCGDRLNFYVVQAGDNGFYVYVTKSGILCDNVQHDSVPAHSQKEKEIEVCRSVVKFVKD